MALNPVYAGDTEAIPFNLTNRSGAAINLTGITITIKKQLTTPPYTITQLTGTINVISASAGQISYSPLSTDFSAGTVKLWIILNNSGLIQHCDPFELDIEPAP